MRTGHTYSEVGTSWRRLRRAANVIARRIEHWRRGDARLRAAAVGDRTRAAPAGAERAATTESVLPGELAHGQSFRVPEGLALTVTAIGVDNSDSRHVVIDVRVTNVSDHTADFENNFGVLDAAGTAHRYTWVNSQRYPDVLPGIATLEPGAELAGKVHVLLPELSPEALAMLRPAYLRIINSGCGGCNHEVVFLPQALWQPSELPPSKPITAGAAVLS